MRRTTALAGAGALLTPLLLAGASAASAATSGSLTVTALGRDGRSVVTYPQAVNVSTRSVYYLTSGKAHTLPKGTYDLVVDVWNQRDGTDTLGGRRVTVSGATRATIDARQGRPVRMSASPALPGSYVQQLTASVCVGESGGEVLAWAEPGKMYVIPSGDTALEVAYGSSWTPADGSGDRYLGTGEHRKGLPGGISGTVYRSRLATVNVVARKGPVTGDARITLMSDSGDSCLWGVQQISDDATLPYAFTAHVPAGSWSLGEQTSHDYDYNYWRPYGAGRTYGLTLNRAVRGPGGQLPYTWGHRVYLTTPMFVDPVLPDDGGGRTTYKLTGWGRTWVSKTAGEQTTVDPVVGRAGWYTLTQSAAHSPGGGVPSSTATLNARFYADPARTEQARFYLTRFTPGGLNSANQALHGADTTVALGMQRDLPNDDLVRRLSDSVRSVRAWSSTDGGRTWHAVRVTHSGSAWAAVVRDPASGYVSLRSQVTDSHGDTSTTTVTNAYGVR